MELREILEREDVADDVKEAVRKEIDREKYYQMLFQQSVEAIYMFDPETKQVLEANPAFLRFLGYKVDEAAKLLIYDFIDHDRAGIDEHVLNILNSSGITVGDRQWKRKDGTLIDVHITASKIQQEGKNTIFVVARDITKRKEIEQALRESEERYRILVNTMPDIIYHIDESGMFTFVNDAIRQLGYEPEELIGQSFSVIIHPDDLKKVSREHVLSEYKEKKTTDEGSPKLFNERRTGDRKTTHLEVRLIPKDQKAGSPEVIAEVSATGHYVPSAANDDKEFKGTIGVIRDVTERKRLEEKIQLTQRMCSLGILAGGISHDIGNLLVTIGGFVQLIVSRGGLDERQREWADVIAEDIDVARGLRERLNALSKGAVSEKVDIDVYDEAKKVFSMLSTPEYAGVKKKINFNPKEFYVHAHGLDLFEILFNLVINSFDAIQEKGICPEDYIEVTADIYMAGIHDRMKLPQGEYVHITFRDTGIGMTDEVRKNAFDPYFSTKEEFAKKGQGLGLANVHSVVTQQNKGHIYAEGVEGEGTTFHIYLPKGKQPTS
jgi:PAS domain S-box-containing protein